jgi:hypothetical protein
MSVASSSVCCEVAMQCCTLPVPAAVVSLPRVTHAGVLNGIHYCLNDLLKSPALSSYADSAGTDEAQVKTCCKQ